MMVPKKGKTIPYGPVFPHLDMYAAEKQIPALPYFFCSNVHNSQTLNQFTWPSMDERINKI